jgi:flagellar protein FlbD
LIYLTRLNGDKVMVNVDMLEMLEETPDTVVTLTTGKKIVVKESTRQIREQVIAFRKLIETRLKK